MKGQNTELTKKKFLEAFAKFGNVTQAAAAAGVTLQCNRIWRRNDADYAEKYEEARQQFIDTMAGECRRRAVDGIDEKVFFQGIEVGVQRRYSDNLLMFLLKAADPAKYRDNHKSEDDAELTRQIAARLAGLVDPSKKDSA